MRALIHCWSSRAAIGSTVLLLLVGCGKGDRVPAPSNKMPVILISIDTLRSDHLPIYGYQGVATPNIDELRSDSILYERAYSQIPLTLPSHATMLTGRYPAKHGIRDNIGFKIRADVPTLPELLQKNGYATAAAVSTFVLRSESGIARGFDLYDDDVKLSADVMNLGALQRDGAEASRIAQTWLGQVGEKPFFLFLHLYEPHTPYIPPEPYFGRYSNRYDGEIAYVDELLGRFLSSLRESGVYDRAMIILLSDHGEGLGEHGEDEHGIFLYREAIQVPLMVKLPDSRLKGKTVETPVSLADVFPTIAEQTSTSFDRATIDGRSLLASLSKGDSTRQIFSESYYGRLHFGWSEVHSIVDGRHHFIRAPRPELYDLAADPGERTNVLEGNRRVYAAMRKAVEPLVQETVAPASVDPEEVQKLAALGYLGSTVSSKPGEVRSDPKDKIGTVQQIKLALGYFREERDLEALALFQTLVKENPGMLDIWDAMSRSLIRLQRYEEAVKTAKEAMRLSPSSTHLALIIANASLELQRYDDARQHAELALKNEPAQAHEIMARIHLAKKEYDAARREANAALESKRDRISALLTLARIENDQDRGQAALAYCAQIDKIMKEKDIDSVRRLNYNRGDALARLGRYAEAEAAFRQEIRQFPTDAAAYKNLILMFVTLDRLDDADRLIFDLEKAAPTPPGYAAISETLTVVGDPAGARYWARRGLAKYPSDSRLRKLAG